MPSGCCTCIEASRFGYRRGVFVRRIYACTSVKEAAVAGRFWDTMICPGYFYQCRSERASRASRRISIGCMKPYQSGLPLPAYLIAAHSARWRLPLDYHPSPRLRQRKYWLSPKDAILQRLSWDIINANDNAHLQCRNIRSRPPLWQCVALGAPLLKRWVRAAACQIMYIEHSPLHTDELGLASPQPL